MRIKGRLLGSGGTALGGWRVSAADELTGAYAFGAATAGPDGTYVLESGAALPPGAQPQLAFYVAEGSRVAQVLQPVLRWNEAGEAQADLNVTAPPPPVYYLHGRLWDPSTNSGVYGQTVRAIDRAGSAGEQTTMTGAYGLFELWIPFKEGARPELELAFSQPAGAMPVLPVPVKWDDANVCGVRLQLGWEIHARVAWAGGEPAAGVRVEAWADADFLGGALTAQDGQALLRLPRRAGQVNPPQPTLRIFQAERLIETVPARAAEGKGIWRPGPGQGGGEVVVEVATVRVEGTRAMVSGTYTLAGELGQRAAWFALEEGRGGPDRMGPQFGGLPPRWNFSFYQTMEPLVSGSVSIADDAIEAVGVAAPNKNPFEVRAKPGLVRWSATGLGNLELPLATEAERLTVYRIAGTAIDRKSRRGAAGLRIEAWDAAQTHMLAAVDTQDDGRFTIELLQDRDAPPPDPRLRLYRDGTVIGQPDLRVEWAGSDATVFVEVDLPAAAPEAARIVGRVIDREARTGLAGLRLEVWDSAPRDGGSVGVATVTSADGSFEVQLPAEQAPGAATPPIFDRERRPLPLPRLVADGLLPSARDIASIAAPVPAAPSTPSPALFFRVYSQSGLTETVTPLITWSAGGVGTTVVEIGAPTGGSQEVGLHELGESIANTVDRVQTELARYPKTIGAYVLDEIALDMPVEMRVDELGQVKTKVVDATTPEKNVGQVRMKVRPVVGAAQAASDVPDQPLSVLAELTPQAIATLGAHRIYSVEDLARPASTGAGRAALNALALGVNLDQLLDKVGLLAFTPLPRAVREALVSAGVTSLKQFAEANATTLAQALADLLAQPISSADVTAWQARVREALAVPRPSIETGGSST